MMLLIYNLGIYLIKIAILIASPFNPKARLWIRGRKNIFESISKEISPFDNIIWFHAASLGEFEQGRPLIEKIKSEYSGYKILLTFYSPSGYEVRKKYDQADYVCYLPLDTRKNARMFLDIVDPEYTFFIKYEFWYHFLHELKNRNKKVFLISAIFREDQIFFKKLGKWFISILKTFDNIFIQDAHSLELLKKISITNVVLAGDTRFDRVAEIARTVKHIPLAKKFAENNETIIAGSTWPADEELLTDYIKKTKKVKLILAPHEVDASHIFKIEKRLDSEFIRFSQTNDTDALDGNVLIIDNIGILSSLYQYGKIAYIGGGFGVGIHNILEAATFGIPVVFGPNYAKFKEARDLVAMRAAFVVDNPEKMKKVFTKLLSDKNFYEKAAKKTRQYVLDNIGATDLILNKVFEKK